MQRFEQGRAERELVAAGIGGGGVELVATSNLALQVGSTTTPGPTP